MMLHPKKKTLCLQESPNATVRGGAFCIDGQYETPRHLVLTGWMLVVQQNVR